jgi:hypothetical protein
MRALELVMYATGGSSEAVDESLTLDTCTTYEDRAGRTED